MTDVSLEMTAPRQAVATGTLIVTVVLRNTSETSIDLYLRGRSITFDLAILDTEQTVLRTRNSGVPIPAILHINSLAARRSLKRRVEWRLPQGPARLPAGNYLLKADLLLERGTITSNIASVVLIDP